MHKLAQWLLLGGVVLLASLGLAGAMGSSVPALERPTPVVVALPATPAIPTAVLERAITPVPPTPTPTPTPTSTPTPTAAPTPTATVTPTAVSPRNPLPPTPAAQAVPVPTPEQATPTATAAPVPTPPPARLAGFPAALLVATNDARVRTGLPALATDAALTRAAESYASLMAQYDWFEHTGPNGSSIVSRARDAGYTGRWLGEVLYRGSQDQRPDEIVDGWLSSATHSSMILNSTFVEVGIGCALADGLRWCVEELGAP